MKKLFIKIGVLALVMGCTERQQPLFRQAWELIEDKPDSTKSILEKVIEINLTESGQAEYGLLKTIADYILAISLVVCCASALLSVKH